VRGLLVAILILTPCSLAFAQQQPPDPAALQRVLKAIEAQRNAAMNSAALAEARAAELAEEMQKLKAEAATKETKPKDGEGR